MAPILEVTGGHLNESRGHFVRDSVKDFARKCKGKQGRARLAAAVGVLAMLLILLSELFPAEHGSGQHKNTKVCPEQHGISGTAGEPAGTSDLTDERCGQNDRDGHAGDWGRSHLCAGYTVRRNAVPADPCPAGRWFSPDRNGSVCRRCAVWPCCARAAETSALLPGSPNW